MKKKGAKKLSPLVVHGIIAGAVLLVVAIAGYFLLIGPQRSKAKSLDQQIKDTQAKILQNRTLSAGEGHGQELRVADVYRVSRAVPDSADMPDVILQLDRIATASGISFNAITPGTPIQLVGYVVQPIDVEFEGNFYDLSNLLYRMRNLVRVREGQLDATGRLFTVDKLSFAEGQKKFPQIDAKLTIDAYVFGGVAAAPTPTSTVVDLASTGTTSTTPTTTPATTQSTPTPTAPVTVPNGATAAGVTP